MTETNSEAPLQGELEVSCHSQLSMVDLVQEVSDRVARKVGFDEDSCYWIGLSVRESVTNAIEHGNKLDQRKKVWIRFKCLPDRLVILVKDEGEGFDESQLPDPTDQENLLKPGGRGVFFVRSFMDEVEYRRLSGGGLEMRMEKRTIS